MIYNDLNEENDGNDPDLHPSDLHPNLRLVISKGLLRNNHG